MFAMMSQIQPAIWRHSGSLKPRVVAAGEPIRIPLVTNGGCGSLGTAFLLTVMWARPKAASSALPVSPLLDQVHEEQVVVGAAGDDLDAAIEEYPAHGPGVLDDLFGVGLELRLHGLPEGHRLAGDDVHERAALVGGKHHEVDLLFDVGVSPGP